MKFSFQKFIKSFGYAFRGIGDVFLKEQNFKVHSLAAILAIVLGFLLKIAPWEWCVLILVIAMVLAAEMANTAIENLCNAAEPGPSEIIRVAKDVSAGMVLICAIGALGVGIVVFLPKIIAFLQNL